MATLVNIDVNALFAEFKKQSNAHYHTKIFLLGALACGVVQCIEIKKLKAKNEKLAEEIAELKNVKGE